MRHIALRTSESARPAAEVVGRLYRLDMIDEAGGALTQLGRSAIVTGSPVLWSS